MSVPARVTSPAGVTPPTAFFVVLRRMRAPLIVLIVIFSVGVAGLMVIPGQSPTGPWRMSFLDAFYFMSYTASTIGFGEIPQAFDAGQRMWVTLVIFLSVVGWAYAIGTLLSLLQDSTFKAAWAVQRFRRQVARIREPFWILAGHGQTGALLGEWLDDLDRRFVAVDLRQARIDVLDLGSYHGDVPGLAADARDPEVLTLAGLLKPSCQGVLALTDDDEANLAVTMTASVLRPDVTVIARCTTPAITRRMEAFGSPIVVNPFDRFGDHFRLRLRSPAVQQLDDWLTSAPGAPLPARPPALQPGSWVVCGYGRFGSELSRDLRAAGLEVVVVEPDPAADDPHLVRGDGTEPHVLDAAGVADAVGFAAATDNDVTNLSLVRAARRVNPDLLVVGRQNQPTNAPLFEALDLDLLMVPSRVVAQEALAHIGTPQLWRFLQELHQQDDSWASALLDRIVASTGEASPELWLEELTPAGAPALLRQVGDDPVCVGDLLRDPLDRDTQLQAVVLMVRRGDGVALAPSDDYGLLRGDLLLVTGRPAARRALATTLTMDPSATYVLTGEQVASGWLWRTLSGQRTR